MPLKGCVDKAGVQRNVCSSGTQPADKGQGATSCAIPDAAALIRAGERFAAALRAEPPAPWLPSDVRWLQVRVVQQLISSGGGPPAASPASLHRIYAEYHVPVHRFSELDVKLHDALRASGISAARARELLVQACRGETPEQSSQSTRR